MDFVTIYQVIVYMSLTRLIQSEVSFKSKLPHPLLNLLNDILQPLVTENIEPKLTRKDPPKNTEPYIIDIHQVIKDKIKSLNLHLEDNDAEGDTTIIEFLPRSHNEPEAIPSKKNHKIKKMRDTIKITLDKESVADEARSVVMKNVDKLINKINNSKCTQKRNDDSVIKFKSKHSEDFNMTMKEWKKITELYLNNVPNTPEGIKDKLDKMNEFFLDIMGTTQDQNKIQRIRCQIIDDRRSNSRCDNFNLCSDELENFLTDYYNNFKETASNTFSNYAEMYKQEINDDIERANVVNRVIETADANKNRIDKVFEKLTQKFKLSNEKDHAKNIHFLEDYITNVKEQAMKTINKYIEGDLQDLRMKTLIPLQQDLLTNLGNDLNILEKHFIDKICKAFNKCNGRRKSEDNAEKVNKDNVYVKLKDSRENNLENEIIDYDDEAKSRRLETDNIEGDQEIINENNMPVTRTTVDNIIFEKSTLNNIKLYYK